jgi:tetratricopeptide (TPR) repeat protein
VRAHPLASLIWLLFAALAGLFPPHDAGGASLTWNQSADREELVFTFETRMPLTEPRQRGLKRILLPLPIGVWTDEEQPALPDFSDSRLIQALLVSEDSITILTKTGDFLFSSSSYPGPRELVIEFYLPPPPEPDRADEEGAVNASAGQSADGEAAGPGETMDDTGAAPGDNAASADGETMDSATEVENATAADNATDTNSDITMEDDAGEFLSGTASVRGRINRPEQAETMDAGQPAEADSGPDFMVRMPIDRNATIALGEPEEPTVYPARQAGDGATGDDRVTAAPGEQSTAERSPGDVLESEATGPAPQAEQERLVGEREPRREENATAQAANASTHENATTRHTTNASHQDNATTQFATNTSQGNATARGNATEDNSTAELEELYRQAQIALATGDLEGGREAMSTMLEHPGASEPLREELLYNLAFVIMQQGKDDLEGNFTAIREAYEAAQFANPSSSNVPEALYQLGYLHLAVGNIPEAKGNFDLLRRSYPDNPRVPMIDVFWGDHFLEQENPSKAVEHYRYVIQNFAMSQAVKPANVGLLKAYTELGFFDKAMEIVRDIEKRWPRYYLENPSFLMAAGYAAMLSGNDERAREYFWAYANIVPEAPDADVAMARIGDIHLKQNRPNAAREIYHRTAEAYPDREGGLIAQMRLAEEGVLDEPSVGDMAPVFDRPDIDPELVYTRILKHTESPLAPVARLKLAMWRLWKKQYPESLDDIRTFLVDYPRHELLPKAREVADKALRDWMARDLEQENFEAMVQSWMDHQDLFRDREPSPEVRLMAATAFMRTGRAEEALDMVRPFVFGSMPENEFSGPGLDLTLALLVDRQEWKDVVELSRRVAAWKLGPERKRQVDYATALALEQLDRSDQAEPLWTDLATDLDLTDTQRGYAHYFLGRDALAAGEYERASILGQEALELLKKKKDDLPKLKETLQLLMQAAEKSGRFQEALAWSLEYDDYISPEDGGWPAHAYRKGILFRKAEDMKRWRETLVNLNELFPNTLYGRMAAAELEGVRLKREVEKIR